MNKSDYGHKPIESTGGKAKSKHTERKFIIEVRIKDGVIETRRSIENYTLVEALRMIEIIRNELLEEYQALDTKPAARDKGDDML